MDKTQQAAQLRLAADLLETGHPWEHRHISDQTWTVATQNDDVVAFAGNPTRKIRPVLATPPDGRPLHNPDNLTAEQVGVGKRLFLVGEDANKCVDQQEKWKDGEWVNSGVIFSGKIMEKHGTYRLPLSVPWPEAPKPDPYADLKAAHAAGKVIQSFNRERGIWQNCPSPAFEGGTEYRIKPDAPTFQLPPPPPGMKWHREDGWEEGDLPQGYRPICTDEANDRRSDEYCTKRGDSWDVQSVLRTQPQNNDGYWRTSRPLTFTHGGKQWTWHRPGDPMPCDGERMVHVLISDDLADDSPLQARQIEWNREDAGDVIGWRYADEKKTVPLGPEDVKPFTVIRRKGEAQTWHWRTVSYVDAVKVTCGNRGYGWNELASSYERNESLPLTGKWNPSAWEPCSKPA